MDLWLFSWGGEVTALSNLSGAKMSQSPNLNTPPYKKIYESNFDKSGL